MLKNTLLFKFKSAIEHYIKHLGTFMSAVMTFGLGFLLIGLDYFFPIVNFQIGLEWYTSLIPIINVFISILIAVLLTTFSVIFVVKQLASSQFSPRILRYFLANDLKVQQFIGIFIGTIALCLLPQIAIIFLKKPLIITVSVALLLCFRCLVWSYPKMITHLSDNMNVSTITNRIKCEVINEVHALYQKDWQIGERLLYKRNHRDKSKEGINIITPFESGYLDKVNYEQLSTAYNDFLKKNPQLPKSYIYQKPIIGEFIMAKTTVLLVVEFDNALSETDKAGVRSFFQKIVLSTFSVNKYRSYTQDINFGVRKLVDIAIKAISPAVNDPTTCLNCIDYLGEIVRVLSIKKFPSTAANELRHEHIYINEFGFDEIADFCFDQIYQWGKNDPTIVKRLIRTIRQIIPYVENPYNLMILIKEIKEMDIQNLYGTSNKNMSCTQEHLDTIQRELAKFKQKAIEQIEKLEQTNRFQHYAAQEGEALDTVRKEEVAAIQFLKRYIIV